MADYLRRVRNGTKPYASFSKALGLGILLWACRAYLPGEPAPLPSLDIEMEARSNFVRQIGPWAFPAVWFGCLVSIFAAPFLACGILRVGFSLLFLGAWTFDVAVLELSGASDDGRPRDNQVDSGVLILFWAQRGRFFETLQTFSELIPALVGIAILAGVFCWPPSRDFSIRGKWNIAVCLPVVFAALIALYTRGGTSGFPTPVGLPIRFVTAIATGLRQDEIAERFHSRPVTVAATEQQFQKIIVIMDESIRAGFVDPSIAKEWNLIDYGVVTSIANCSHTSRYPLKRGFRPSELPDALREHGLASEHPTIWQYAKAAGYKTILIDALGEGVFHSGRNSDEISYIDESIYITSRPHFMRDFDALEKLRAILSRPGRDFIWVDKQGAHHPFQQKYPPDFVPSFAGPPVNIPESDEWREYQRGLLDRYNKAVGWSASKFLAELFKPRLPAGVFLLYTSDHGQSLVENSTKWPQCSSGAMTVAGEGLVPLLLYAPPDGEFAQKLRTDATEFKGRYSQFEVFPTLLIALGFSPGWVTESYGPSLLDFPPAQRSFLKGGNERLLEWHRVD